MCFPVCPPWIPTVPPAHFQDCLSSLKRLQPKRVYLTGSALKEEREDSTDTRSFMGLICFVLTGDVTHALAAIMEVPGPWALLTVYANVWLCYMVHYFVMFDWDVVIQSDRGGQLVILWAASCSDYNRMFQLVISSIWAHAHFGLFTRVDAHIYQLHILVILIPLSYLSIK